MKSIALRSALVFLLAFSLRVEATPGSGYWWNPAEPGRGFVIEIQGSQIFMAGFLYAASGAATWVASSGAMTSPTQYSGSLITYKGGQTLVGTYQTATLSSPPLGNIAINFTSDTTGTVTWPGGTIPIQRFDFGRPVVLVRQAFGVVRQVDVIGDVSRPAEQMRHPPPLEGLNPQPAINNWKS